MNVHYAVECWTLAITTTGDGGKPFEKNFFEKYKIKKKIKEDLKEKTYNSRYSLVVTHPTTNLPI